MEQALLGTGAALHLPGWYRRVGLCLCLPAVAALVFLGISTGQFKASAPRPVPQILTLAEIEVPDQPDFWLVQVLKQMDQTVPRAYLRDELMFVLKSVLIPYVLRSGAAKLIAYVTAWTNTMLGGNVCRALISGHGDHGDTYKPEVFHPVGHHAYDKFLQTRDRLRFATQRLAVIVAVFRVLLWHLMQPFLYFVVFYAFSEFLTVFELCLGLAVGVREIIYVLTTLLCIFYRPAVFLYFPSENSFRLNVFYVVMPEKFLLLLLPRSPAAAITLACIALLDTCAAVAFVSLIWNGQWYPPLLMGYFVTAMSALPVYIMH